MAFSCSDFHDYSKEKLLKKVRETASLIQLRPRELCGDLIVSGHTLTIFTSFYAFKYYAPKKLKPLSYMLNMLAFMAVIAILFARKHYTIDVVLGFVYCIQEEKANEKQVKPKKV
ncbi:hypothetical protein ANCDUO_22428 [Ancylostoma duodenale]|uniref:Sphingomyelin synthase-like domain-containing protein n=1 Tax=Ancylostoma duodenale TaxID=51022 RepID=A0A0C2CCE1_9BILA|nr:hypothetical protein ANCDUO_22428 [Ancylostoma duodenale]